MKREASDFAGDGAGSGARATSSEFLAFTGASPLTSSSSWKVICGDQTDQGNAAEVMACAVLRDIPKKENPEAAENHDVDISW